MQTDRKLFFWKHKELDVCVQATCEKDAWEMLWKQDKIAWWVLQGEPMPTPKKKSSNYADITRFRLMQSSDFATAEAIRPNVVNGDMAFVKWIER